MIQRVDNIFSEDDGNSWLCLTLKGCQGNRCRDVVRYHNNSQDWAAIVMRSQKKHFTIRSKVDLSILTFTEKIVRIQFVYCSCQNVKNSLSHYFSHFCWIQATVAGRYRSYVQIQACLIDSSQISTQSVGIQESLDVYLLIQIFQY